MTRREVLLQALDQTVAKVLDFYAIIPDADVMVYELWSARDVLAHLTFWHESFARNVSHLVNGRKPNPLRGRLMDLNQASVETMRSESLDRLIERFRSAHQTVQAGILDPQLVLIPYRISSRSRTPEEHLQLTCDHITKHMGDVRKTVNKKTAESDRAHKDRLRENQEPRTRN